MNKIIVLTLGITLILVAIAALVYLERNISEPPGKTPNPKLQTPNKSQLPNPKNSQTQELSNSQTEKVSVPIKSVATIDNDPFDKYPPDKEMSVAEHIRYVLFGRFKMWPPDGFREWVDKNRESAIPILLNMLAGEGEPDSSANARWRVMTFLDSFTAPEAFDKLYDIALNPSGRSDSRQFAILALKNYGEKSVDYILNIYKGNGLAFRDDQDMRSTKTTCLTAIAFIAANPNTKDPVALNKLTSFFKEQYYQQDVQGELMNIFNNIANENPRSEFLPFFQMVGNDTNSQYKESARQATMRLDVLSSPDADNRLVNILNTNYDYDMSPQDSSSFKELRYWAAREFADTSGRVLPNMPAETRILYLRNVINTESNKPYNVDNQMIKWAMGSIIKLGGELTPSEKELLRGLH